ncbi:MAG: ParA family protein [Rhodopila sp.]
MIVTVGSTKGGVGKTTIALQLALARTLAGSSVLLADGDRQGSALTAVSMRSEAARSPGLACVHYPDERVLRAQVQQQGTALRRRYHRCRWSRFSGAPGSASVVRDPHCSCSAPLSGCMGLQRYCRFG